METEKQSQSNLVVPREEAARKIQAQIDKGQQLVDRQILSPIQLEQANTQFDNWTKFNEQLLTRLFDNSAVAEQYTDFYGGYYNTMATLEERVGFYERDVNRRIERLKGILEQLELIPEKSVNQSITPSPESTLVNNHEVFIVHGHDGKVKSEVARFVDKVGLKATILDEKPGGGRTIIEKFEYYASNACFAIVLLTPDDVGAPKDKQQELKPRARQNVIFEIGYFFKGLGRGKVCTMSTEEVEFPSDLNGVSYIHLDSNEGWKLKLFQEMEATELPVDNSKLV